MCATRVMRDITDRLPQAHRLRLRACKQASKRESAAAAAARAHGRNRGRGAVMTRVMRGDGVCVRVTGVTRGITDRHLHRQRHTACARSSDRAIERAPPQQ